MLCLFLADRRMTISLFPSSKVLLESGRLSKASSLKPGSKIHNTNGLPIQISRIRHTVEECTSLKTSVYPDSIIVPARCIVHSTIPPKVIAKAKEDTTQETKDIKADHMYMRGYLIGTLMCQAYIQNETIVISTNNRGHAKYIQNIIVHVLPESKYEIIDTVILLCTCDPEVMNLYPDRTFITDYILVENILQAQGIYDGILFSDMKFFTIDIYDIFLYCARTLGITHESVHVHDIVDIGMQSCLECEYQMQKKDDVSTIIIQNVPFSFH